MSIKITSVSVHPPTGASERGGSARLCVEIGVKNTSRTKSYHVWRSLRSFGYDAHTKTLELRLADNEVGPAGDVVIISDHPLTPHQIVVEPGASEVITVPVPSVVKSLPKVRGGLGVGIVEQPVGPVERVECTIAYADTPYQPRSALPPAEIRAHLAGWGQRAHAVLNVAHSN